MEFDNALNFILGAEGGYSDDPADRGGKTNLGISSRAHPGVDVAKLSRAQAAGIYKRDYWDAIGADTLPADMRLLAFDTAVQHGAPKARELIEASGGDPLALVQAREQLYKNIVANDPSQAKFSKGWANRLNSVQKAVDPRARVALSVAAMVQQNRGDDYVLAKLAQAGMSDEINYAQQQGFSAREIVDRFGGDQLAQVRSAQDRVRSAGAIGNFVAGAGNAVEDLVDGGRQLGARVTGDDDRLKQLQQQQIVRDADPERQAVAATTAGKAGNFTAKAVPYVFGGLLAPEGLLPAIAVNSGIGAVSGALAPTTGDGQFARNVITETALAGGTTGLAGLAAKRASGLVNRAMQPAEQTAKTASERLTLAKSHDLPAPGAALSDGLRRVLNAAPESEAAQAFNDTARQAVSRKLLAGVGQSGDEVTPSVISAARNSIYDPFDQAVKGKKLDVNPIEVGGKLQDALDAYNAKVLPTYRSGTVQNIATDVLDKVATGEVDAAALNTARKNIRANAWKEDGDTARALNQLAEVIDEQFKGKLPDAYSKLQKANEQWRNLQTLEKVVEMTRGQPTLTPNQLATAIKTVNRDAFQAGKAPYQDLADAAIKLYGPAGAGGGLQGAMTKAIGSSLRGNVDPLLIAVEPSTVLPAMVARRLLGMAAAKVAASESPALVRYLTGTGGKKLDPAIASYIAKALGSAAGPTSE